MSIACISNHFFPINKEPRSIIATLSITVAVVSAVFLSLSLYLQWSVPANAFFFVTTATAFIIPVAIICLKPSRYIDTGRSFSASPSLTPEVDNYEVEHLFQALKEGNVQAFKETFEQNPGLAAENILQGVILINRADENADLAKDTPSSVRVGYSLLELIIMRKNVPHREEFLLIILEKMKNGRITLSEDCVKTILACTSQELIRLFLIKVSSETVKNILEKALEQAAERSSWIEVFLQERGRLQLKELFSVDEFIEKLVASNLEDKFSFIKLLRDDVLESIEVKRLLIFHDGLAFRKHTCNLLHLAIDYDEVKMVKALLQYDSLVNKNLSLAEGEEFSPLHRAVIKGSLEIVKLLLNAGANPNAVLKDNLGLVFPGQEIGARPITPLMIAYCMKRTDIIEALLQAFADPSSLKTLAVD